MGDRPVRRRDAVQVTPFLLGTILVALVSTAVLIVAWYLDASAPTVPGVRSPDRANLILAAGLTGAAWASVIFAISRDVILRRIDEIDERVTRTTTNLVERVAQTSSDLTEQVARTASTLSDQLAANSARLTDHITRTGTEITERLARTATDLVEQAEQSGVFRGMKMESGHQRGDEGWVVPFQRPPDPERPDRPGRGQ